jgi:hypothetical protein
MLSQKIHLLQPVFMETRSVASIVSVLSANRKLRVNFDEIAWQCPLFQRDFRLAG